MESLLSIYQNVTDQNNGLLFMKLNWFYWLILVDMVVLQKVVLQCSFYGKMIIQLSISLIQIVMEWFRHNKKWQYWCEHLMISSCIETILSGHSNHYVYVIYSYQVYRMIHFFAAVLEVSFSINSPTSGEFWILTSLGKHLIPRHYLTRLIWIVCSP